MNSTAMYTVRYASITFSVVKKSSVSMCLIIKMYTCSFYSMNGVWLSTVDEDPGDYFREVLCILNVTHQWWFCASTMVKWIFFFLLSMDWITAWYKGLSKPTHCSLEVSDHTVSKAQIRAYVPIIGICLLTVGIW